MHGDTTVALPGRSIFNCVAGMMKPPVAYMEAGWIAVAAKPAPLALPYRKRKPPTAIGCESVGLPATASLMYLSFALNSTSSSSSFVCWQ